MRIQLYILTTIVGILLWASAAVAAPTTNAPSVVLAWDRVTDPVVTGYRVYWGVETRKYTNSIVVPDVATTTATVTNLSRGTKYYFAATSVTPSLESDYSTEVSFTTLALPPSPVNVTIRQDKP